MRRLFLISVALLGLATAAAELVGSRQTIALDVGSTTYRLAELLSESPLGVTAREHKSPWPNNIAHFWTPFSLQEPLD